MQKHQKGTSGALKTVMTIIITALVSSGITAAVFLIMLNNLQQSANNEPTVPATTASASTADTAATAPSANKKASVTASQKPSDPAETQENVASTQLLTVTVPEELAAMSAAAGTDAATFEFSQLVTVKSDGDTALISCYEKNADGSWAQAAIEPEQGFVGRMGVSTEANENASYTPFGVYPLGTAFGIKENPGTKLDWFDVTESSYWVDDPESAYYNQHVEGAENADWNSAEHLIDVSPNYNYAALIGYNTDPVEKGAGSAFFLHVGSSPTAGCVAVSENKMVEILKWLDKSKLPHIMII